MNCQYCNKVCQKAGKQANGIQKYYCKACKKHQQAAYQYSGCKQNTKELFVRCLKTGNSLSGIQTITEVAVSTQIRWIRKLGKSISPPVYFRKHDEYELDELCTYVKDKGKRRWVISAISKTTGQVIDFKVGTRTAVNLKLVVDKLLELSPKAIHTDGLRSYKRLIPRDIHKIKPRGINKIERYHLTLRTHIKRLNRKTICFAKKEDMLSNMIKINLWT